MPEYEVTYRIECDDPDQLVEDLLDGTEATDIEVRLIDDPDEAGT